MRNFYLGISGLVLMMMAMGCSSARLSVRVKQELYARRNSVYKVEYKGRGANLRLPNLHAMSWAKKDPDEGDIGKKGHRGPHLWVSVLGIPSGDSMLLAVHVVSSNGQPAGRFIVNPRLGRVGIFARGGAGGGGGQGGDGHSWLWRGRDGGTGGIGGDGGMGGTIEVRFDSSALAYVDSPCIAFFNPGGPPGDGGSGGEPGGKDGEYSSGYAGAPGDWGPFGPDIIIRGPDGRILRRIVAPLVGSPTYIEDHNRTIDLMRQFNKKLLLPGQD